MKGPVPKPVYEEIRKKYQERIIATHARGDQTAATEIARSIEQEFVDAGNARGLPGQTATPHERIAVDVATARNAKAEARGESELLVARTIADAAESASVRINNS